MPAFAQAMAGKTMDYANSEAEGKQLLAVLPFAYLRPRYDF